MEFKELEIKVFNDEKYGVDGNNQFLGRVKLYGAQFAKRGQESLVCFAKLASLVFDRELIL